MDEIAIGNHERLDVPLVPVSFTDGTLGRIGWGAKDVPWQAINWVTTYEDVRRAEERLRQ